MLSIRSITFDGIWHVLPPLAHRYIYIIMNSASVLNGDLGAEEWLCIELHHRTASAVLLKFHRRV